jgi:3-dehydroquinate synthase
LVRVTVPIPGRSYDVCVGLGIISQVGDLMPQIPGASTAFVVADRAVSSAWFEPLAKALEAAGLGAVHLSVPAGEEAKTLQVYEALLHQLATQEAHRDDLVVALGGGAVGDVAGFVASTYMRGVPFVQVPTTLLAQVDAAIGGKTAVNLPEGKNLAGTFFQPRAVIADVGTLATLPERDFRSGLAEVAKYGLTLDAQLLELLERDPAPVVGRDPATLEWIVTRCVAAKASTVAEDEHDSGRRLILNYGHTIGHALERLDGFAGRSHGEAVAVGMMFAARLAEARGITSKGLTSRISRLLTSLGLEVDGSLPDPGVIVAACRLDKKYRSGVRFVLLEDVGQPVVVDGVTDDEVRTVLETMGAIG